ncbi:MAG: PEP-CTERM sorting domain-containing protein [Candidatus Acidiferrales bacterium]
MRISRLIAGATLGLLLMMFYAGPARADIFKVEQDNGSCQNLTQAVADCNSASPWQLSTLLTVLSTPNILDSLGEGTDVFRVTNNIANSFSFELQSTGQNGTGVANNGSCQISGGAAALFDACMIMDSLGQTTDLGGAQINNLTFPATVSFSGASDLGATFQLEFVSMQGTSNTVPEPGTIVMLGTGILGLIILGRRRKGMLVS